MGYEYHDRKRDYRGRFQKVNHNSQVHIYCTFEDWRILRMAANTAAEELSTFCRRAALDRAGAVLNGAGIEPKTVKMRYQTSINGGQVDGMTT